MWNLIGQNFANVIMIFAPVLGVKDHIKNCTGFIIIIPTPLVHHFCLPIDATIDYSITCKQNSEKIELFLKKLEVMLNIKS